MGFLIYTKPSSSRRHIAKPISAYYRTVTPINEKGALMTICYYCKQDKTKFPSKYVGKKICADCCTDLGLVYCLTTLESLNAHKRHFYPSFEAVLEIVKPRKQLYDELAAVFTPTHVYPFGDKTRLDAVGPESFFLRRMGTIEIDTDRQIIHFFSENESTHKDDNVYIRYQDITGLESHPIQRRFSYENIEIQLSELQYSLYGAVPDSTYFATTDQGLLDFLASLVK